MSNPLKELSGLIEFDPLTRTYKLWDGRYITQEGYLMGASGYMGHSGYMGTMGMPGHRDWGRSGYSGDYMPRTTENHNKPDGVAETKNNKYAETEKDFPNKKQTITLTKERTKEITKKSEEVKVERQPRLVESTKHSCVFCATGNGCILHDG